MIPAMIYLQNIPENCIKQTLKSGMISIIQLIFIQRA